MNQEQLQETTDKVQQSLKKTWVKVEKTTKYQDDPSSYAYGVNKYKLAWLFVLGSILGCLAETVWYLYLRGRLLNRQGVLFGPFSPIYGVMFVLITMLLYKIRNDGWKRIFMVSMLSVSGFEYFCSWAMENILGTKAWTYKNKAFNLNGRICLQMCIMWGILGVVYMKVIYPMLSRTIERFKPKIGKILGAILFFTLVLDCLFSFLVSYRQTERRKGLEPSNAVEEWMDRVYTDERLKEIYSEIRVVKKSGEEDIPASTNPEDESFIGHTLKGPNSVVIQKH